MPSEVKDREMNQGRSVSEARFHVAMTAVRDLRRRSGRERRAVRRRCDEPRRTLRPGRGPVECGTSAATVPVGEHHEVSGWM